VAGSPQEIVYSLRGPLEAGTLHLEATGIVSDPTTKMHADVLWRAMSGAADQTIASADSITMTVNEIPPGNIVADLPVSAVGASCGDQLVVRATLQQGMPVSSFEVTVTLP
jgi:hypothetical protein